MTFAAGSVALNKIYEGFLMVVFSIMMKENFFYLISNKSVQIDTPYDQNGRETIPFGVAHTYITRIREYPHNPGLMINALVSGSSCPGSSPGR